MSDKATLSKLSQERLEKAIKWHTDKEYKAERAKHGLR